MSKSKANSKAISILPESYNLVSSSKLCSLWSNYGSISRLQVTRDQPSGDAASKTSLILKTILPPPSSETDEPHLRKLLSYRAERYFYKNLSRQLSEDVPGRSKVAELINFNDEEGELLLEDLAIEYPVSCYGSIDLSHTKAVLSWLAGFHGTFWNSAASKPELVQSWIVPPKEIIDSSSRDGIWQRGGYWYLATRQSEYESLLDSEDEYGWLIPWTQYADQRISNEKPEWKTVVHGDAKGANIVFGGGAKGSDEALKVAMYDFQYCGVATPTVDLVYFLGTTVDRKLLEDIDGLLKFYYDALSMVYREKNGKELKEDTGYTFEILKGQWEVAVVDWMRFMAGWGVWGNWRWVEGSTKLIIEKWEREGRQ